MRKSMRKLVAFAMSFLLVFAFVPAPALADIDLGDAFDDAVSDVAAAPDNVASADAAGDSQAVDAGVSAEAPADGQADAPDDEAAPNDADAAAGFASGQAAAADSAASAAVENPGATLTAQDYTIAHDYTIVESGVEFAFTTYDAGYGETALRLVDVWYADGFNVDSFEDGSIDLAIPGESKGLRVGRIDCSIESYFGKKVRSLTIPASVDRIDGMFNNGRVYDALPNVKSISFEPGSKVTTLPQGFFSHGLMEEATLPDSLAAITDEMFVDCYYLTSIDVPAAVTSIGDKAFYNCMSLATITFQDNSQLQTIGASAFSSTGYYELVPGNSINRFDHAAVPAYSYIAIPDSVTAIGASAFEGAALLTEVSLGSSPEASGLVTIGERAFAETALTSVTIPDSVVTIGKRAFDYCHTSSEYLDDDGVYRWTSPDNDSWSLATVQLGSSQEASHLESIGSGAFSSSPITEIVLPNSLRYLGYDEDSFFESYDGISGESAFTGCQKLETVVWPTAPGLDHVGGFAGCVSLKDESISSIPSWVTTIDDYAFSGCKGLRDYVIPGSIMRIGDYAFAGTLSHAWAQSVAKGSLTFADGNEPLTIGDYAFSGEWDESATAVIDLPQRVTSVGKKALTFASEEFPTTYIIRNKDIVLNCYDESSDTHEWPWTLGQGAIVYYPSDAAADSDIMKCKALVEAEEAERADGDADYQFTRFLPIGSEEPAAATYAIHGTVPAGAKVLLSVDYSVVEPAMTGNSFSYEAEAGADVSACISLDGYLDYVTSPQAGQEHAPLNADWTFAVTADEMTPVSQTGALQVLLVKDMPGATDAERAFAVRGSTVTVFDAAGRIVARGVMATGAAFLAENLPAGEYTVVAFDANDYFNTISGPDDLATLGIPESGYAKREHVLVNARQTTELELTLPDMDTSAFEDVLASGSIFVSDTRVAPETAFFARVSYELNGSWTADAVKVNVPEGIQVTSVNSVARKYNVEIADEGDGRVLVISGLADDDVQKSVLYVGLRADVPGAYSVTASVDASAAGAKATAAIGSVDVSAPALTLDVPSGLLPSDTFKATVNTVPGTEVKLRVNGVDAVTIGETNKLGSGSVDVTIPEEAKNSYPVYLVEAIATVGDQEVTATATVEYSYLGESLATVTYEFMFRHAGEDVYLVKNYEDVSGDWYTCVAIPSAHPELYSPTWPFRVVVDSRISLGATATVIMKMCDDSVRFVTLAQDGDVVDSPGKEGMKRYTYTADVPIGDGNINHSLEPKDIPCEFDVVYSIDADSDYDVSDLPQAAIDAFKTSYSADYRYWLANNEKDYDEMYKKAVVDMDLKTPALLATAAGEGHADGELDWDCDPNDPEVGDVLFKGKYRHEDWDPDGLVWSYGLDDEQRAMFLEYEEAMDDTLAAYQECMGDEMPLSGYGSAQEYLEQAFGYRTGLDNDPAELERQGYTIIRDGDLDSVPGAGVPDANGNIVAPEWYAYKIVEPDYENLEGYEPPADLASGMSAQSGQLDQDGQSEGVTLTVQSPDPSKNGAKGKVQVATPTMTAEVNYTADAKQGAKMNAFGWALSALDTAAGKIIGNRQALNAAIARTDEALAQIWKSPTVEEIIANFNKTFGQNATSVVQIPKNCGQTAKSLPKVVAGGGRLLTFGSVVYTGYCVYESGKSAYDTSKLLDELDAESEKLKLMQKYFNDYYGLGNVQGCRDRVWKEDYALYWYRMALMDQRCLNICDATGTVALTGMGMLAGGWAGFILPVGFSIGTNLYNMDKAAELDKLRRKWLAAREERINWCRGYDELALAFMKDVIMDPSGYVYESVESNRLSGVVATIYELVNGTWTPWTASDYNQVNDQVTGEGGLFAWDVPEGIWKVVFSAGGYEEAVVDGELHQPAETDALAVPPAWTNIAVGLISKLSPTVTSVALSEDGTEIVVSFSQYMKTGEPIDVDIDGVDAEVTWVDPVEGENREGGKEPMSKSLCIPVPADAAPGATLQVGVSGGENYAGLEVAQGQPHAVVLPGEPEQVDVGMYYYVEPASMPTYELGSGATLTFTFKRTENDGLTFGQFDYLLYSRAEIPDGWVLPNQDFFDLTSGSAVVELHADFLEGLNVGEHKIAARFKDAGSFDEWPQATFKVVAAGTGGETDPSGGGSTDPSGDDFGNKAGSDDESTGGKAKDSATRPASSSKSGASSPATGDGQAPVATLLLFAAALSAIALTAAVLFGKPRRRGKHIR